MQNTTQTVLLSLWLLPNLIVANEIVRDSASLVTAVRNAAEGATIELSAGTFELDAPLELKAKMSLQGAGIDKTILTHSKNWKPSTKTLPDPEMKLEGLDTQAYLILIKRDTSGVTISDMTLHAPQLHGAVFAWFHTNLHLQHLRIKETLWSGVRTFGMQKAKIHDCEFIDAGGRWEKGQPGVKGGITGGGIFACWMSDCEIYDNRFTRSQQAPEREYYGIKCRQGKRIRVHHNTIETNFSAEFPFENDEDVELDHNVFHGTISIPKHAGGPVPANKPVGPCHCHTPGFCRATRSVRPRLHYAKRGALLRPASADAFALELRSWGGGCDNDGPGPATHARNGNRHLLHRHDVDWPRARSLHCRKGFDTDWQPINRPSVAACRRTHLGGCAHLCLSQPASCGSNSSRESKGCRRGCLG